MNIALATTNSSIGRRRGAALLQSLIPALALIVSFTGSARAAGREQITIDLTNGDKVSGEFVAVDEDVLQIETPYAGCISVNTAAIKDWEAPAEKVRKTIAALFPDKAKSATVAAKQNQFTAQAVGEEAAVTWERSFNFVYSLARGNSNLSDLNLAVGAARKRGQESMALTLAGRRGVRDGTQEAHLFNATFRYEHPLGLLPAFSEGSFEVDRIQQLKYRLSESAGVNYHLLKRERSQLSLDLGTGLSREVFSTGLRRNLAFSLVRATAEQSIGEKFKLNQQVTLFSNLFHPANSRLEIEAAVTMPLTKHLALQLSGVNRYDHRPQGGAKPNDLSLLTGFKFVF